ncbi:hypothetical protein F3D3_3293 [Fusibacter sp. 3D3]|nr:hypothetical protein F3D3_3293 [Fusibacter sp. 3D3]
MSEYDVGVKIGKIMVLTSSDCDIINQLVKMGIKIERMT